MRYLILLFVLNYASLHLLNAQPYFSDYWILNNYYGYEELTGAALSTASGDDGSEVLTLPFQFEYCGVNYSTIKVSTNGWLQFGATYNGPGNINDLSDPQYKNFACPLWDDLIVDSQSSISYKTEGAFPARYFVVQWKNVKWKDSNNRKNFQVWLVEFDNSILFFYGPSSGSSTISSSIGVTNDTGGINNFISVNISGELPFNGSIDLSQNISYNISSLDLIPENNLFEVHRTPPSTSSLSAKLYQVPDTLYSGGENQVVFALLHYSHFGMVLTPPWMTKLKFNTYGTTNTNDILRAKVYNTGRSPVFNPAHQIGSTIENPGSEFEIGNLNLVYFGGIYVSYFWLVFDIAPGASMGNIIDATCTKIEAPFPYFYGVPDSSLSSGYHIIGPPVPVELISFNANIIDNNVHLNWATATETNNKGFEIERKTDDSEKIVWDKIAFVNGKGTTTEKQNYSYEDKNLSAGKYIYRLKQIDYDGSYEYSKDVEVEINIPFEFSLSQNYPNPFNPTTKIKYTLPISGLVAIKVYDILGNEIATLVNEVKDPGNYEVEFNGGSLSSGVYFYKLSSGSFVQIKKMCLIK